MNPFITDSAIKAMLEREAKLYVQRNPKSQALSVKASAHWLRGVPMQWMVDWGLPFPLFVNEAKGATLQDADGHSYIDFCLGDTGAMFGHSPEPVAACLAREGARGLTTMLPSADAAVVGELLFKRFGLPFWQVTATASDANRAVIRWARAITGRKKILVFNHCYHGAVDETFVTAKDGKVTADPTLVGEPRDLSTFTKVVEFNDAAALEQALREGDVACVLAEPVMTNVGMVLPAQGFLEKLRILTKETGTLLVIDETHTLTSSPGGYARSINLQPDALVFGKPVAGGIPAALYGFSDETAARVHAYMGKRGEGRSGIGTTLSGSRIQMALIRCVLEEFMTDPVFEALITLAKRLERGVADVIIKHSLPWHVTRVGARVEFMCVPRPPKNGSEASQVIHKPIDEAVHRFMLNRGVVITPFHNMMLICPATTEAHVNQLLTALDSCVAELKG